MSSNFKLNPRGLVLGKVFRASGDVLTINSQSIRVLERDPSGDISKCSGTVTITDGGAGFAKGCRYQKTDGTAGSIEFINEGTTSSCDFNAVRTAGQTGALQYAEVSLTNAEILALRATPKSLVAAPGAGVMVEFDSALILNDYTGAYTESADNLAIRYENGSGTIVSEAIEMTGFADATADTVIGVKPATSAAIAKSASENKALVLHNTGDGEFGGGNAANVWRVKIAYRLVSTGF